MEPAEDMDMSEADLSLKSNSDESFSMLQDDHLSNGQTEVEPFSLLSDATEQTLEENTNTVTFQSNESPEQSENENDIQKQAVGIVSQIIDDASLSLRSSGDFSMLNDANALNKDDKTEHSENEETDNKTENEENKDTTSSDDKTNEWLDILGNGLLKKKVISPGQGTDSRPQRGQEVTVLVETSLEDETIVEEQQRLKFVLGDQEVTDAIDLSVVLMENGEKCRVVSDAKYCHGEAGKPPKIAPNTSLTYNLELINIQDGPYSSSTPINDRLNWVDQKRQLGNKLYSEENYSKASAIYIKCNRVLQQAMNQEQTDDLKKELLSLYMKCHNNLAAAFMKLSKWKDALRACEVAENLDAGNVKTFFRKGKILANLGHTQEAIKALKMAVSLSPEDKVIQSELGKQQKKLTNQNEAEKKMYQRMLGGNSTDKPESADEKPKESWIKSSGLMIGGSLVAISAAVLLGVYMLHK